MNKSLLDTDVLSEINKAKDAALVATASVYVAEHGRFTISVVTLMEVVRGYHLADRRPALAKFLESIKGQEILAFSQTTAELAGKIDADLLKQGTPIGRADPMIAATAIEHGLSLATGNAT